MVNLGFLEYDISGRVIIHRLVMLLPLDLWQYWIELVVLAHFGIKVTVKSLI